MATLTVEEKLMQSVYGGISAATSITDYLNASRVRANTNDIADNAENIKTNADQIAVNVNSIATNTTDIKSNLVQIKKNTSAINTLENTVSEYPSLATSVSTLEQTVATNITSLQNSISTNTKKLSTIAESATKTAHSAINGHLLINGTDTTVYNDSNKVDKIEGKSLSTNDYTTEEKTKLSNIAESATKVSKSETIENGHIIIDDVDTIVYDDTDIREWLTELDALHPITITTFTLSPKIYTSGGMYTSNYVEKGTIIESLELACAANRTKNISFTLNGEPVQNGDIINQVINTTTSFTLAIPDKNVSKTFTFYYVLPFFEGVGTISKDNATTKTLLMRNSYTRTLTTGENQYMLYAFPESVTPSFSVDGFAVQFTASEPFLYSEALGNYILYNSPNPNVGKRTVTITLS